MAILATGLLAMAQLFAVATTQNVSARATTSTTLLARQKAEQLRSLTWGCDARVLLEGQGCLAVSDLSSNTAVDPPQSTGGTGLSAASSNSLTENIPGYVDFLDGHGRSLGTGATPPAAAIYVRRWSIEPLPTNPNNTLILQVLVFKTAARPDTGDDDATWLRQRDESRVSTVKTRKAQ